MAIYQLFNWQDDDSTKSLNHRTLGISEPGRYRGYDSTNLSIPGGMVLRLSHDITGVSVTKFDDPIYTVEKRGVILTKQGVVIQDSGLIDFNINTNTSGNPRIDTIIAEHSYVDIPSGSNVIYAVIQGIPSPSPVPASISPNEQIKTIVGYLYVPSGTTALTDAGVIYTQSLSPSFANDPSIMRTHLEQNSTGVKRFSSGQLNNLGEALYITGGSNVIDLQNSRLNNFILMPIGTPYYLDVQDFINSGSANEGYSFRMVCYQKFRFLPGGNINTLNSQPLYVEEGEEIFVQDVWGMLGIYPNVHFWIITKGAEARKNLDNKFRKVQMFSQGLNISTSGTAALSLGKDGNSYECTVSTAQITGIVNHEPSDLWIFTKPKHFGGAFIFIKFITSPVNDTFILKNNVTLSAPSKKIITPTGADVILNDKALCLFIEYPDRYELVSVIDSVLNPWTLQTQISNILTTLTPESWKYVGAGGTMANGQPVPSFGVNSSNLAAGVTNLRLRKDSRGYVEIEGAIKTTGVTNLANIWTVLNFPIGYRPANFIYSIITSKRNSSNDYVRLEVTISTSGVALVSTSDPITGTAQLEYEFKFSFDTL